MTPLALDDAELAIIERFAAPLPPQIRGTFLERVCALVAGEVIGPGSLHRACATAQNELREAPPIDGRGRGSGAVSKYSR
jgi:hypothetical protein